MGPWKAVSHVAVVSPCQMVQIAMRTLLRHRPSILSWHSENYQESVLQQLLEHPVDLVIVSLHIYQPQLPQAIRLIQRLRATQLKLHLMVIIDVEIPYLVSKLRSWGVNTVLTLRLPLVDWHKQILSIGDNEMPFLIEQLGNSCALIKAVRLSPMESRVMRYLIEGFSMAEIAGLMMRSIKTVSGQKSRALHKMGISHYAQLIALKSVFLDSSNEYDRGWLRRSKPLVRSS